MTDTRPILFLDVDGVLNPMTDENQDWSFVDVRSEEGFPLRLSHDMAGAVRGLGADVRWLTTWAHTEDRANPEIGGFFGWEPLPTPMIGFPRRFGNGTMCLKTAVVKEALKTPGQPVLWIDDQCEEFMRPSLAGPPQEFDPHARLIWLAPNPDVGLSRAGIDFLRQELALRGY